MASSAPCVASTCLSKAGDLTPAVELVKIQRLISDKYTIISLFVITTIIVALALIYFGKQLYDTIKQYLASKKKVAEVVASTPHQNDNEDYNENVPIVNPTKYFEAGKSEFVKDMDKSFKEYNQEKTKFITSNYDSSNDDLVDQSVFYNKYDNYEYTKQ